MIEIDKGDNGRDIYKETSEKWGVGSQMWMAVEEMGELATALSHYIRGRITEDEVAEEIADVMFVTQQMAAIFGRDRVEKWLALKKRVVIQRLDEPTLRAAHDVMKDWRDE